MDKELIYIYDPLCGWCYGFSPVMKQLHEKFSSEIKFTVKSGGMVTGSRVGPVSSIASYILGAYKRLENMTGVQIGEPYLALLREGTSIQNSEPGCLAMTIFKDKFPDKALHFAHEIQNAIFKEGKEVNDPETFIALAAANGFEENAFREAMKDDQWRKNTWFEIKEIQGWGITGFPSLIYKCNGQYYLIAKGYASFESILPTIERINSEQSA